MKPGKSEKASEAREGQMMPGRPPFERHPRARFLKAPGAYFLKTIQCILFKAALGPSFESPPRVSYWKAPGPPRHTQQQKLRTNEHPQKLKISNIKCSKQLKL